MSAFVGDWRGSITDLVLPTAAHYDSKYDTGGQSRKPS
jgi:hypothetical protein